MGRTRRVSVRVEQWAMRAPFRITGYVFNALDCLVVEIAEGGCVGRGEAAGVYYLEDRPAAAVDRVLAIAADIESGLDRATLQALLTPGCARNAVDCALWDLECKLAGETIWERTRTTPIPLTTCQTIGVLPEPEDSANAAKSLVGYSLLKLKLDADRPIDRVRAVRAARPDARLIVDVNQGFTLPVLEECLPVFAQCSVELVEQPLPRGEDAGLEGLARSVPLCADESCLHRGDLAAAARRYDVINIKLDKTGGLTEALALADEIASRSLGTMVGNMLGTSLAMAPAYIVGVRARIADLDGPVALRSDRLGGLAYNHGVVRPFGRDLWG